MAPITASSALVNVVDGAELSLVTLLDESAAPGSIRPTFVGDCESCIAHSDASQLVKMIVAEQGAIAALVSLDDEAVSAISLLAACLDRVDESGAALLNQLADSIISVSTANGAHAKAISLLAALYNMRKDPTEKVGLLVKMIRLAVASGDMLEPEGSVLGKWMNPTQVETMLNEWKVEPVARRELYQVAAEASQKSLIAKQQFTLLVLETYSASDVDASGMEAAKQAAIGAIRDPVSLFVQQRKILSLPATEALQTNDASLYDLLKVFQEGNLEDYNSFIKSKGGDSVLAQWDLSAEDCARHMRILSLCSLASEHEEIPYALVAETLQTDAGDVEKWVIAAVSSGLLSAKMDQLQEKIMVERSAVRRFDMDQWRTLQSRLHLWKQNVGGILEAYKQSLSKQEQPVVQ
mmetsp:Transcript_16067/g.44430  ORF Transcript_16067/g.44430 Transcript_16067/m.44430 type:complete len:408 (-) Transcript_16067:82-1305(-)|eukprot:CAMPEP_0172381314 /NCGR_PEP_ID=MMETSP1060-20121228/70882_1 /TAXON_ID=37318 /ORGANISM="Pseudo-nitzschia pungens, Strain cf. cingulata" /LENGTH=407 /DNA_ID=CAMNT_0013109083 /DNA_START=102 /DNA_END=1325 /DNA_ORIENTATION=+